MAADRPLPPELVPDAEIRPFGDTSVQRAINAALATIPPGHRAAAVAFIDLDGRARFAMALNAGHGWSFGGYLAHDPAAGSFQGAAAVRKVW